MGVNGLVMADSTDDQDETPYFETNSETGQIERKYSDEDFLAAVKEISASEDLGAASTSKVAERVGCERTVALGRLKSLAEAGNIEKLESDSGFHWKPGVDEDE